jgi:catechol 2,3-dioxygenase-like lactoylglutathione lyase family enzyme
MAAAALLACLHPLGRMRAQQTLPLVGIASVSIRVQDFAASRSFYQALGYQETFRNLGESAQNEALFKINDHQFLELVAPTPQDAAPRFLGLCFETGDLIALHEVYGSHGLNPTAIATAGGGESVFSIAGPNQPLGPSFTPAPQQIQFVEYQPEARQAHDAGQHLGSDRIAERLLAVSLASSDPAAAREFFLNDLDFRPLPGRQMLLHLPGSSGQFVAINPARPQGARAEITLETDALGRAERHLHREHILFNRVPDTGDTPAIVCNDPNGNTILITAATPRTAERTVPK